MSVFKYCPECKDPLSPGARGCGCGWYPDGSDNKPKLASPFCTWSNGVKTCPALGTVKHNGDKAKWLCMPHFKATTMREGVEIVLDYERNGVPKRENVGKERIEKALAESPELFRKPGEPKSEYIIRARSRLSEEMKKLRLTPTYKAKKLIDKPTMSQQDQQRFIDQYNDQVARLEADGIDREVAESIALKTLREEQENAA